MGTVHYSALKIFVNASLQKLKYLVVKLDAGDLFGDEELEQRDSMTGVFCQLLDSCRSTLETLELEWGEPFKLVVEVQNKIVAPLVLPVLERLTIPEYSETVTDLLDLLELPKLKVLELFSSSSPLQTSLNLIASSSQCLKRVCLHGRSPSQTLLHSGLESNSIQSLETLSLIDAGVSSISFFASTRLGGSRVLDVHSNLPSSNRNTLEGPGILSDVMRIIKSIVGFRSSYFRFFFSASAFKR